MSDPGFQNLPEGLPVPQDDGAARHLPGMRVSPLALAATDGTRINLSGLPGRTVVYAYPMTGRPGVALPEGWDAIPGARGCTPQSCAFRDHFGELRSAGASAVFGLSTQGGAYQREAKHRLHLPFELLSDASLELAEAMKLPTFRAGETRLKRLTMILDDGVVTHVFYPVFPPNRNGDDVVAWLRSNVS